MYRWRSAAVAPIVAFFIVAATGCFATKSDFNQLRDEIATVRAETATVDSVRAMQMVQLLSTLRALNDTLTQLSTRLTRVRAETQSGRRDIGTRVLQVQEASGQSQASIREMRAALEQRNRTPPPAPPGHARRTFPPAPPRSRRGSARTRPAGGARGPG